MAAISDSNCFAACNHHACQCGANLVGIINDLPSVIKCMDTRDIKVFNSYLKNPGILNVETNEGTTLLMYAAEKGKAIYVKLLLNKSSLTQLSTMGARMPAFHYGVKSGKVEIMQLFIKHGKELNILDGCGRSALDVARFYHHRKGNQFQKIESLLKAANIRTGAAILAGLPQQERTIVLNGQREVCYQLALRIFRSQKKEDFSERLKVEYGISLEAQLLASIQQQVLEDETRPKVPPSKAPPDDKKREMPKTEAAKSEAPRAREPKKEDHVYKVNELIETGKVDALEIYLKGFSEATRKKWKFVDPPSPLMAYLTLQRRDLKMFKVLLQYFPFCINNKFNEDHQTALHLAVITEHLGAIDLLVNHPATELNNLDAYGCTPMDYVIDKENFKWKGKGLKTAQELTHEERKTFCARAIKEYCKECLSKEPNRKFTPKEIVDYLNDNFKFSYHEDKIAKYLKSKGWLKLEEIVSVANDDGKTEVTFELVEVEEEVEVDDDEDPVSTNPDPDEEEVLKPAGGGRVPDYLDVD